MKYRILIIQYFFLHLIIFLLNPNGCWILFYFLQNCLHLSYLPRIASPVSSSYLSSPIPCFFYLLQFPHLHLLSVLAHSRHEPKISCYPSSILLYISTRLSVPLFLILSNLFTPNNPLGNFVSATCITPYFSIIF